MISRLKRRVPERIKGALLARMSPTQDAEFEALRGKPKVVVGLAGFYQNLGDLALTLAQVRFIEATLPGHSIVMLPSNHTYTRSRALERVLAPGDVITLIGGGNMSDLYESLEDCRLHLVRRFPDVPIVAFPQTIAFSETPDGRRALARSRRTYRRHPRLHMFARETESARVMATEFVGPQVSLCPDSVLSMAHVPVVEPPAHREGAFLVMRSDEEVGIADDARKQIVSTVKERFARTTVRDTVDVALEDCTPERYESALRQFWERMSTHEVVVTDRLHAMIFAALTRTPCIALPTHNHKLTGVHAAWLSNVPWIRLLDTSVPSALETALAEVPGTDTFATPPDLRSEFGVLSDALRAAAKP